MNHFDCYKSDETFAGSARSNVKKLNSAWARRLEIGSINVEYEVQTATSADASKVLDSANAMKEDPSQQQKFLDSLKWALENNESNFPAGSLSTLTATTSPVGDVFFGISDSAHEIYALLFLGGRDRTEH